MMFGYPDCLLCDDTLDHGATVGTTGRHGAQFTTVACRSCGLVQHLDVPDDATLATYYRDTYRREFPWSPLTGHDGQRHEHGTPEWGALMDEASARMAENVAEALRIPAGGRTLEIGCGEGRVSSALAALGFAAFGDEADPAMMEAAESRGVRHARLVETLPTFDAVLSIHNLEHMRDPVATLVSWRDRMVLGGKLWIEVPNVEHPYGDLDTHYWQWPHITCWRPQTLMLALVRAGFDDVSIYVQDGSPQVLYARATHGTREPVDFAAAEQRCRDVGDRACSDGTTSRPQWHLTSGAEVAAELEAYRERLRTDPAARLGAWLTAQGDDQDWLRAEYRRVLDALDFSRQSIGHVVEQCEALATSDAWSAEPWVAGYESGVRTNAGRVGVALSHLGNQMALRGMR